MVRIPASSMSSSTAPKTTLHVECCMSRPGRSPEIRADEIEEWLRLNYASVSLGQVLTSFPGLPKARDVEYVKFADISTGSKRNRKAPVEVSNVKLDIDLFHYVESTDTEQSDSILGVTNQDEFGPLNTISHAKVTGLPNRRLHGLCDSLIFEEPLELRLLKFILRMVSFTARQSKHPVASWSRLLLLYGPSGTGKSTLCKALAQQLSIRFGKRFPTFKLVEVDAQSVLSKYYSESGKAVSKLFDHIESLLAEREDMFVCIILDEIESLASTRQHSINSNEPQDSLRAVNALLVGLDLLRDRPNVIVLCTSNLIKALDPAFLDRVDKKQYVPLPCAEARYEIFRARYLDMAQRGMIAPNSNSCHEDLDMDELGDDSIDTVPGTDNIPTIDDTALVSINAEHLPPYERMMLRYFSDRSSWSRKLWDIAEKSTNLSGRALHRLPMLSLATYAEQDPCPMDEALAALAQAVDEELITAERMHVEDDDGPKPGKRQRILLA